MNTDVKGKLLQCLSKVFPILILTTFISAQLLIGTYSPSEKTFHFNLPYNGDMHYYISIGREILNRFPPNNPIYAGIIFTQNWITCIPLSILMLFLNPNIALRVLNILWLFAFLFVVKRYFPKKWEIISFIFLCCSSPFWKINPAGIDFLARAFCHIPFYLFFLIAVFERKNKALKYFSALILPFLHGQVAVSALFYFFGYYLYRRKKENIIPLIFLSCGLFVYILLFKYGHKAEMLPIHSYRQTGVFRGGFFPNPIEPIKHIFLFLPFIFSSHRPKYCIMFFANLFASFFNRFYYIFILNLTVAFLISDKIDNFSLKRVRFLIVVVLISYSSFIYHAVKNHTPFTEHSACIVMEKKYYKKIEPSLRWIRRNTPKKSIFLVLPPRFFNDIPLVEEERAIYIGYFVYVKRLQLKWKKRYQAALNVFNTKGNVIPPEVDYVFYGPREKELFPFFRPQTRPVYRDGWVEIYKVAK